MVNITIDGKQIEIEEGITVLEAARQAGIHIPTLCDHPQLAPYGGCRVCIVEVEGARTLQTSCTMPVMDNMIVHTQSDKVKDARKFVLSMIFSDRNHFCPYCVVNDGDCELQQVAYGEDMTHWPIQPNWQSYEVDASHGHYLMDHNRCILCRRCVRACAELSGNHTLGVEERGAKSMIIADLGTALGDSSCVSCGTCVQVCPTGALIDRRSAYLGQDAVLESTKSVCTECSIGCSIEVFTKDNHIVKIEGDWESAVNGGVLCEKGRFLTIEKIDNTDRITKALVKENGKLVEVDLKKALDQAAAAIKPLADKNNSGVAAVASSKLSAETLYRIETLFGTGLGSNMVTSTDQGVFTQQSAYAQKLGKSFEGTMSDLATTDCVVDLFSNLVEEYEVASFFIKRNQYGSLILADNKENELTANAKLSMISKKNSPVQFARALSAAIMKLGLNQSSLKIDADAELKNLSSAIDINSELLLKAAHTIGSAEKVCLVYDENTLTESSSDVLEALTDLVSVIGDKAVLLSMKGKANSVAASQYGMDKPFKLNGHKAVFAALGDDTPTEELVKTLEKADYLVVQASYPSKLTEIADVVLPSRIWAEENGHFVNLEGRLQVAAASLEAPQDVLSNEELVKSLQMRLLPKLDCKAEDWKSNLFENIPAAKVDDLG